MALDPLYWSTSLNLNFEGANGSTTFTDIGPIPKTATATGSAQISTAQSKTGAASLLLASATADYLSFPTHAGFDFGTGDFCVECWWRPVNGTSGDSTLFSYAKPTTAGNADIAFNVVHYGSALSGKIRASIAIGTTLFLIDSTSVMASGVWAHIAFQRINGYLRLYINGISENSPVAAVGSINIPATATMRIGRFDSTAPRLANGYIDGARITKGNARYGVTFTPFEGLFEISAPDAVNVDMQLPALTGAGNSGGFVDASLPQITVLTTTAGVVLVTLPMLTVISDGHDAQGERSAKVLIPSLTLAALGGALARITLPALEGSASATVPVSVRALVTLPMLSITAGGVVTEYARASVQIPSMQATALGGANAKSIFQSLAISSTITTGAIGRFVGDLPMIEIVAVGTAGIVVTAHVVLPMLDSVANAKAYVSLPMLVALANGGAVVAIAFETYAINLKPSNKGRMHEVTRYTGMPFTGVVRWKGDYYGWGPGGLYLIGGDTDYNAAVPEKPVQIPWDWMTTVTDFGSSQRKAMRQMTVGGRLGPRSSASVSIGKAADFTYRYATAKGERAQNYRVKFGKGLDDRYYSIGLSGTGICDVDTIDFDVEPLSRK